MNTQAQIDMYIYARSIYMGTSDMLPFVTVLSNYLEINHLDVWMQLDEIEADFEDTCDQDAYVESLKKLFPILPIDENTYDRATYVKFIDVILTHLVDKLTCELAIYREKAHM